MFSAHLRAIWHRYRYWSHMLLVLMLTSIYVVRTLAFSQEKYAKTKSTAWRWKCSNNTHSSPNPTMHSGFPSFISRLVTTAENGAVPNRPLPCLPTILCCYLGSQVCACPSPRLKPWDYFRTGGSCFRKNLSPVLTAEIRDLGNQPPACRLLPWEIPWPNLGPFSGTLRADSAVLQDVSAVHMGSGWQHVGA